MANIAHITRDFALRQSAEESCGLAVEACPNGMVMTDSAGRIVLANAEIERMFGYDRSELLGQTVEILLPERLRNGHLQHRAAFLHRPEMRRLGENRTLPGRHRDGSEFPVEIGLFPVRGGDDVFVLGVIVDVGNRSRMDRLKDEFVSTVSHELRTPLTSIAGSLGLLIGGAAGALPEPAARLIRIAQTNSQRLVRLINDILDIEKMESGQVSFRFRRLSARAVVEQAIEANRAYADGFQVRIRLDPGSSNDEVYADADRLAQIVTNLLSNAIKFSPRDGEVVVAITENAGTVRLAVRDRGQGIPREFRSRIFEKFAQADGTDARRKGGTGLGLSIVKQIATKLGGSVGFEDAEGGGTIFWVALPGWSEVAACDVDPEPGEHAARILFCGDSLDDAMALRDGLRPAGFRTDFAHSPDDCVKRVQAGRYDAILVDLDLGSESTGLIRTLRAEPEIYKTPILALSSDSDKERSSAETANLNVLECIRKPADTVQLAQTLNAAIRRQADGRPQVLHVDDDSAMLEIVAHALDTTATVISAASMEEARCALLLHRFDLVILDIALGGVSGFDLIPDLRSPKGTPIPVIVFSARGSELKDDTQVKASLSKGSASLRELLAAVHDRLKLKSIPAPEDTA
jgi:PAS domain S-box-containing protein